MVVSDSTQILEKYSVTKDSLPRIYCVGRVGLNSKYVTKFDLLKDNGRFS